MNLIYSCLHIFMPYVDDAYQWSSKDIYDYSHCSIASNDSQFWRFSSKHFIFAIM
ncbi:hypothetical protein Syun_028934 [Stephania yunnanensis]|uniref:Uncharacterized protein n=1 Tax=Stephania yunnanensis TaxID=152371 RepID=A0AAP0E716_9MAGN